MNLFKFSLRYFVAKSRFSCEAESLKGSKSGILGVVSLTLIVIPICILGYLD